MQGAVGVDRQLTKSMTSNVTYLYSRGVHQYLTNNISAAGLFPEANISNGTYPSTPIAPPPENNMQYQSGGVYRQQQVIASVTARYARFSIFSFYVYNNAKGDTSGVTYTPSIAADPGFDYGRTSFDVQNRFLVLGNIMAPWQLSFAPFLSANSGTPYNLTTGKDLTGNNQFNARPTYAASCNEVNAISTPYGCLDANPLASPNGSSEKIVPYDLGTGPSNVSLNLRVSKVIGFGPKVTGGGGGGGNQGGGPARRRTGRSRIKREPGWPGAPECDDVAQIQPDVYRVWAEYLQSREPWAAQRHLDLTLLRQIAIARRRVLRAFDGRQSKHLSLRWVLISELAIGSD